MTKAKQQYPHWVERPESDIEPDIDELKKRLIEANGELSTALEELQYAQDNNLTHENMDEIADMVKSAEHKISVFFSEVE